LIFARQNQEQAYAVYGSYSPSRHLRCLELKSRLWFNYRTLELLP